MVGEELDIAGCDVVLGHLVRMFAQGREPHFVVSAADFGDIVVEHGEVVFPSKIFGSI